MMDTGGQLDPGLLSDYVAGELDAQTLRGVERYLAASSADRERVRAYQTQSRALYRAYESVLYEPVPARLLDLLRDGPTSENRTATIALGLSADTVKSTAGAPSISTNAKSGDYWPWP